MDREDFIQEYKKNIFENGKDISKCVAWRDAIDELKSVRYRNSYNSKFEHLYNIEISYVANFDGTIEIDNIMSMLNENDKRLINMYFIQGYTQQEISCILNIARSTVSKRISRIINNIRKKLCLR